MKERDKAEAKIAQAVTNLLNEADKTKLTLETRERFQTLMERTLPQSLTDSPTFIPLLARIKTRVGQ